MPEPRNLLIMPNVSTRTLNRAVKRLSLAKMPATLSVIDRELSRRKYVPLPGEGAPWRKAA